MMSDLPRATSSPKRAKLQGLSASAGPHCHGNAGLFIANTQVISALL